MKKIISALAITTMLSACQSGVAGYDNNKQTYGGAAIGAIAGAAIGSLTGHGSTDRRQKAMIGAALGALAGGGVGQYMDQQEAAMRAQLEASDIKVKRMGNELILNMPSKITFDTNSSSISPEFRQTLSGIASVLNRFPSTTVSITGHTDSSGDAGYNQTLSENRARAVATAVINSGINQQRIMASGLGESQPIATNTTAVGKSKNRRVEIKITPIT